MAEIFKENVLRDDARSQPRSFAGVGAEGSQEEDCRVYCVQTASGASPSSAEHMWELWRRFLLGSVMARNRAGTARRYMGVG